MDERKGETIEQIMRRDESEELRKINKVKAKKGLSGIWVSIISVAITLAVVAGGYFGWQYYGKQKGDVSATTTTTTSTTIDIESSTTTTTKVSETNSIIYVNTTDGLRLRATASTSAEILETMPFGAKLTLAETSGEWSKVTHGSKTGWCMTAYTSKTNPLIFNNTDYGFRLTFPESWYSVDLTKRTTVDSGATAYFDAFLSTSDTTWDSGLGKSSMFVIGIYTKTQWAVVSAGEIKPGLLGEGSNYVYTYSPSQATPSDLMSKRDDINNIVKTFEVL